MAKFVKEKKASDGICTHDAKSNGSAGRLLTIPATKISLGSLGYTGGVVFLE